MKLQSPAYQSQYLASPTMQISHQCSYETTVSCLPISIFGFTYNTNISLVQLQNYSLLLTNLNIWLHPQHKHLTGTATKLQSPVHLLLANLNLWLHLQRIHFVSTAMTQNLLLHRLLLTNLNLLLQLHPQVPQVFLQARDASCVALVGGFLAVQSSVQCQSLTLCLSVLLLQLPERDRTICVCVCTCMHACVDVCVRVWVLAS